MLRRTLIQGRRTVVRGFHSSRQQNAASIFGMPLMSPTMDKGGIIKWNFKEGELFSAGDSLLEVETDKATIDVELQDDGILAKIVVQEGAKDIPVGQPIAVVAEPGDDLATIEMPDTSASTETAAPAALATPAPAKSAPTPAPAKSAPTPAKKASGSGVTATPANPNQTFFPSVELLLHHNNISREDALKNITSTAPNGRITKGDVLLYLGTISKDAVLSIASFIDSKSHLDLSNIKLAEPKAAAPAAEAGKSDKSAAAPSKPAKPAPVNISKQFVLAQQHLIPTAQLKSLVKSLASKAEQFAYLAPAYKSSDYIDPIFEELCAPSANVDRFKVAVSVNPGASGAVVVAADPFDALLGTLTSTVSPGAAATVASSVDITLTINEKAVDAKDRANLFLSKFGQLLTAAVSKPEPTKVEEFEF